MSRLSLVAADLDREYLSKLERFLMVNYPQRFDIYSFSSCEKLSEFLDSPDKRDILLINSTLFTHEFNQKNVETVILLKGDGPETIPDGIVSVNKYQHAEMLVTDILRLYAARGRKSTAVHGPGITRMVCFHSPVGGAGGSSIAAGCSILCARRGLKTFYLNLEDIPSTNLFFNGEGSQSFSNVIYHLKGTGGGLGLKLEGAKCCDPGTGVYFFAPPESVLEMNELSADDISRLLAEIKGTGFYDAVFIDLPAGLNERNITAFRSSDVILMILADCNASIQKTSAMQKGLEILDRKYGTGLAEKLVLVLNRYGDNYGIEDHRTDYRTVFTGRPIVQLDEIPCRSGACNQMDLSRDTAFLSALNRLLKYVLVHDGEEIRTYGGGGYAG